MAEDMIDEYFHQLCQKNSVRSAERDMPGSNFPQRIETRDHLRLGLTIYKYQLKVV